MANIEENGRQIVALWNKIDEIINQLADTTKQAEIKAAVEKALSEEKDKRIKTKDKWLKLIWIPIILLIISTTINWVIRLMGFMPN